MFRDISHLVRDKDAFSLGEIGRFADPILLWVIFHSDHKLLSFLRQDECAWPEVKVILSMEILHSVNAMCQEVFTSELDASREVIDLLELGHSLVEVILERLGGPHDQPVILHWPHLVGQDLILLCLQVLAEAVILKHVLDELDLHIRVKLVEEAFV